MDCSKLFINNWRHRALLHNNLGVELAIEIFGDYVKNPDGRLILVRDIAMAHIEEDCDGAFPTFSDWFSSQKAFLNVTYYSDKSLTKFDTILKSCCGNYINYVENTDFSEYIRQKYFKDGIFAKTTRIGGLIPQIKLTERWMNKPQKTELIWLKKNKFL